MELPDNARPIKNSGAMFAAFINRNTFSPECSYVLIFPRKDQYGIDFNDCIANYETLSRGATMSARREIKKLEKQLINTP
jgi:hypothetical protein